MIPVAEPVHPYSQNLPRQQNRPTCNLSCKFNEICQPKNDGSNHYECVCPVGLGFFKINNVCREYLPNMVRCDRTWNSCQQKNEDCVSVDGYAEESTCQCQLGYLRSRTTFACENSEMDYPKPPSIPNNTNEYEYPKNDYEKVSRCKFIHQNQSILNYRFHFKQQLERRRPDIKEEPDNEFEDNFVKQMIEEISNKGYEDNVLPKIEATKKVLELLQTTEKTGKCYLLL